MAVKYHERQHKNSDGTWETIREPIYYDGQGDKEQRLERGSLKNNPQIQSIDGKANPYYRTNDSQIDNEFSKFEDELRAEQDSNREEFWKLLNESKARQDTKRLLDQKSREFDRAVYSSNEYMDREEQRVLDELESIAGENRLANEFSGLQSAIPSAQDSFLGGRGAVPTRETSPVRGYNGHTGDTRGVQEVEDGFDRDELISEQEQYLLANSMGNSTYMDQFPQIDGSDDSLREDLYSQRYGLNNGWQYNNNADIIDTNAILNKPYTPSPKREQPSSIWEDIGNVGYNVAQGLGNAGYNVAQDLGNAGYNVIRAGLLKDQEMREHGRNQSRQAGPLAGMTWGDIGGHAANFMDAGSEALLDTSKWISDNTVGNLYNMGQPIQNFFEGSLQGMSTAYDKLPGKVSGMLGDLTDWMSGGDDEGKAAEETEKERKDAYVEEVRKRYEENGFPWTEKEIRYAERQYEKDKAQGLL